MGDDEKTKSIFGVNDIVVPPIFESLKYYDRGAVKTIEFFTL